MNVNTEAEGTGENKAELDDLARAVLNWGLCDLAIAQWLLVAAICKCSINSIGNPKPVYSH